MFEFAKFLMIIRQCLLQNFLDEKNIKLLSDDIKIIQPIKSLGEHKIEINPYIDLIEEIKVFIKKN